MYGEEEILTDKNRIKELEDVIENYEKIIVSLRMELGKTFRKNQEFEKKMAEINSKVITVMSLLTT